MQTPGNSITAYLRAKDENRPYLMGSAFSMDATLAVTVKAGSISFPPITNGRDAITDVLVRRFAQTYENVHTLCLARPPEQDISAFSCDWLVAMTEKSSQAVRVGCGRYDWCFEPGTNRVEHLAITIETMQSLAPDKLDDVMNWVTALPSLWCPADLAVRDVPDIQELRAIIEYIK